MLSTFDRFWLIACTNVVHVLKTSHDDLSVLLNDYVTPCTGINEFNFIL